MAIETWFVLVCLLRSMFDFGVLIAEFGMIFKKTVAGFVTVFLVYTISIFSIILTEPPLGNIRAGAATYIDSFRYYKNHTLFPFKNPHKLFQKPFN